MGNLTETVTDVLMSKNELVRGSIYTFIGGRKFEVRVNLG